MAVRPPTSDSDDTDTVEFGIAAVDAHLEDWNLSFPVSVNELDERYGAESVPVSPAGETVKLATVFEQCETTTFETRQELLNELHPIFEVERAQRTGGLIGRIRTLLPF